MRVSSLLFIKECMNTCLLKKTAGVKSDDSVYNAICPSHMLHSEKLVRQLQKYYKKITLTLSLYF